MQTNELKKRYFDSHFVYIRAIWNKYGLTNEIREILAEAPLNNFEVEFCH